MSGQRISAISVVLPTIGVPYSKVGNDGVGSDYAIWHVPFDDSAVNILLEWFE